MATPQPNPFRTGKKTPATTDLNPFARPNAAQATAETTESRRILPLTRLNFILMGAAAILIVLGFILMTGEPSGTDSFNPDIFSTRRIVVGPTISFLGYIAMGVAIMWPTRRRDSSNSDNAQPSQSNS